MAVQPDVNINYEKARFKGDEWIKQLLQPDNRWFEKWKSTDFPWMCAIWTPYCDEDSLQMIVDWNSWIGKSLSAAQEEINRTLAILDGTRPPFSAKEDPCGFILRDVWDRVKKVYAFLSPESFKMYRLTFSYQRSSYGTQKRLRDAHYSYFQGVLKQTQDAFYQREFMRDTLEYIEMRRDTIGVYPALVICDVNDVMSYKKELFDQARDEKNGLIPLLKDQGLSTQQAMDKIGEILIGRYKRWYNVLADLPVWGEDVDREVLKYIDMRLYMALGNLHWK
ncbi:hypothetical protein N7509_002109 [Penicillium cosmopolitanum]|uniref:Terpene synthase n=1 Tax=Penicillium cosmopolitanum TaxID=1131564 RepID=A0A9X0BD27_9EURO|nr:uncharacterized protein N7509_002109 [Penicillium cosmopolitanum]KAJ5408226.1 hypothetical protein N7509_002109 [Penicillium cosmopolitanum]